MAKTRSAKTTVKYFGGIGVEENEWAGEMKM